MMMKQPMALFNHVGTTEEFLLNKTESKSRFDRWGQISDSTRCEILKHFPDALDGMAFTEAATEALQDISQFSVLAIRIDDEKPLGESPNGFRGIGVLKALDVFCRGKNVIWGMLGEDVLGAYFPDVDPAACMSLSHAFQQHVSAIGAETITIGMAAYPTLNYEKSQILDAAGKALDHAMFFGPNSAVAFDAVSLNISGDNRYQAGDVKGAIEEFKHALQLDPSNVNVHNSLGVCHGILKQYKKALAAFHEAIKLDSGEAMAVYNVGMIHMLKNERGKALNYFMKAYDLSRDVFEIVFHIGKCHMDEKEYDKAIEFFEKAAELQPDSALVLSCLGQCYSPLEMTDKAIKVFQNAIKKNPNDAQALSGLGHLFEIQNENPEIATLFCEQSVMICPENGLFHHRLGRLYLKQNRLQDALKSFITAGDLGHDSTLFVQDIEERLSETLSPEPE